ncbi:PREDICTED: homeobox protein LUMINIDEPENDENS-like [Nelumbo nucifera]|uniref:Homeobox protein LUMINIDEPENDENS-like n=2 Tax=Nelumbo nucifera TaxID=4432 RepID=A0A1U7ZYN7_NELNU|nr:PREDICTED: homeobox protein LUMINIDEPENDENS-like [Nelumbo nucifera]DAD38023.1 TPA_asm: hypothetical protein HUJ06_008664 [Nelumbo nucifera]
MEVPEEDSASTFAELDVGNTEESFQRFLDSQKELFHEQIDQLQKIVVTQCKLTGVNPLSQEMAAGALSIKIGKRPRDLLNPKAVKYMQSVFSIKDTISKKESREISALSGVTVTQVREFFANQRSRVRKLVRLSKDKVIKSKACNASQDEFSTNSDPVMPICPIPLNSVAPDTVQEAPSCSSQDETISGIDSSDKNFLENIFNLMRKEETFSGQVKLMEWVLQIQNASVLLWFLTKDGLMILANWLSQAVLEEQTTVLLVIFKVLCHLPLHKALPVHMSAILQTVNRLRFYRTSDISNRARVLLLRWSKLFVRSQALKKPTSINSPSEAHQEIIRKLRIGETLSDEAWKSKDIPGEILTLTFESSETNRDLQPLQSAKLLLASADDSNRKQTRGILSKQTRERRKVLLVEQPGQKTGGRSQKAGKAVPAKQCRPMSADDIQKAKIRAIFLQNKRGKTGSSSSENLQQKTEDPVKSSVSEISNLLSAHKSHVRPKLEDSKSEELASKICPITLEAPADLKPILGPQAPPRDNLKRDRIPWQTPPEVRINSLWRVGTGGRSKEVEVQTERLRREKETLSHDIQEVPSDPKEPWDQEMDYDDTLTPEIPIEQQPEADGAESLPTPREIIEDKSAGTPVGLCNGSAPEPDLELLAVLLKNPELVFALTSGQAGNLTSEETVRLLDMIKANGMGLNVSGGNVEPKAEVTSLPSPTPPSDPIMNRWRPEPPKDLLQQPAPAANRSGTGFPAIPATVLSPEKLPAAVSVTVRPQFPTTSTITSPQMPTVLSPLAQQPPPALQLQTSHKVFAAALPEKQLPSVNPSIDQHLSSIPLLQQNHFPPQNLHASVPPPLRPETSNFGQLHNPKPPTISIVMNPPKERPAVAIPQLPPLLPTPARPQPPLLPEPSIISPPYHHHHPSMPQKAVSSGKQASISDSRMGGQGSVSIPFVHANQSNYNAFVAQPPLMPPGPRWETNEIAGEPELEMWSPERSPVRSQEYLFGRNFSEPRRDYGRNSSRPPDWSRHRYSGHRDRSRHGRWRDRRH